MMHLWVIVTGKMGESYERAYAWCETKDEARARFTAAYPLASIAALHHVFTADSEAFVSPLSDSGILDADV